MHPNAPFIPTTSRMGWRALNQGHTANQRLPWVQKSHGFL